MTCRPMTPSEAAAAFLAAAALKGVQMNQEAAVTLGGIVVTWAPRYATRSTALATSPSTPSRQPGSPTRAGRS